MKLFVPEEIDRYAHNHTSPRGAVLAQLRSHTLAEVPYSQMQVGRVEGGLLQLLAQLLNAKRIVEIGTYTGYSALCLAEGLAEEGRVITCDQSLEYTDVARKFWSKSPFGHKIELRLGDALETVLAMGDEPIDMVFVDADKSRYVDYYEALLPKVRRGGLVVFDNTLWSGEVLEPESDDARGIARLNDLVQSDERVQNVFLTVRDGILVARKTG
jgi:caffeoyl-CoA O-methyltransferase